MPISTNVLMRSILFCHNFGALIAGLKLPCVVLTVDLTRLVVRVIIVLIK
jgi:hypothetical protein